MKTNIKLVLLVLTLGPIVSCNDFLQPSSNSTFTEATAFKNVDFATKSVDAITNNMLNFSLWDYILLFTKCDNDIECLLTTSDDGGKSSLAHYSATSGTSYLKEIWNLTYKNIELANIVIDNLPKSPLWTNEYSKDAHRLYGEAVTLRAFNYNELISLWGDVPFKTKSTQAGDNFNLPKTDRDSIYEYLIKDLASVEEYVPWMTETKTAERVNKGFVKGLRARMALAYAGYSLRNKTFETKRGRNWQEYYKIANVECKEIMESGKHRLNPSFISIFKGLAAYSQDLTYNENIFELPFGRLYSGKVGYSIGMQFCVTPADPKYGMASGEMRVPLTYYYSFDRKDTRREVSAELYNYNNALSLSKQSLASGYTMSPTKWRKSWITPSLGGDFKKVYFTGVNFPIMRYSDIVLMFAETENEINNGPTVAAKEALSQVRQRAFISDIWASKVNQYVDSVSTSKDGFFNAIVNERGWEFGGEMLRKQDLIRWNLLGSKIAEMKEEWRKIVENERQDVPWNIFYKYKEDGETLEILNPDYRIPGNNQPGYQSAGWFASWMTMRLDTYSGKVVEQIAHGYDPSKNNYLYPIATDIITTSNGVLSNDQIP